MDDEIEAIYVIVLSAGHPALPMGAGFNRQEAERQLAGFRDAGYDYRLARITPPRGVRFVVDAAGT